MKGMRVYSKVKVLMFSIVFLVGASASATVWEFKLDAETKQSSFLLNSKKSLFYSLKGNKGETKKGKVTLDTEDYTFLKSKISEVDKKHIKKKCGLGMFSLSRNKKIFAQGCFTGKSKMEKQLRELSNIMLLAKVKTKKQIEKNISFSKNIKINTF